MYFFFLVFTFLSCQFDLFASNPVNNPVLANQPKKIFNEDQNKSSDHLSQKLSSLAITKFSLENIKAPKTISDKTNNDSILMKRQTTPEFSPSDDQKFKKTKTKLEIIPTNLDENDF